MLLLHRCLATALSKNVAILADNDQLAAQVRRTRLDLKDTEDSVSSLLAGQQKPDASAIEGTAAAPAHAVLLADRDKLAAELRRTELELEDTKKIVSSLLNGQEPTGERREEVAAMRARAVLPGDGKYLLAADLRRTELELEDTKRLVSSLLEGQLHNAGDTDTATAASAQATALSDKDQMAADLRRTTLELEETKRISCHLFSPDKRRSLKSRTRGRPRGRMRMPWEA